MAFDSSAFSISPSQLYKADSAPECSSKSVGCPLPSAPFYMEEAGLQCFSSLPLQPVPEVKSWVSVVKRWGLPPPPTLHSCKRGFALGTAAENTGALIAFAHVVQWWCPPPPGRGNLRGHPAACMLADLPLVSSFL